MTRWGYLALVVTAMGFAVAVAAHSQVDRLPEKIPIHWNIQGEPDGWASKDQTFLLFYMMPSIMAAVIVLGLFLLPWLSPQNFQVESFRSIYDYIMFLVNLLMLFMQGVILQAQWAGGALRERGMIAGMFVFFALIGNVLGKVKPNFWMGIRTPWTLADAKVWDLTHRFAAWLYVGLGLVGSAAVLLGAPPWICLIALIGGALVPLPYSLIVYKKLERAGRLSGPPQPSSQAAGE